MHHIYLSLNLHV